MRNPIERPVCHRAEDMVTYLYGEASEAESGDFKEHLAQCDACRTEFGIFNQVHDSIQIWRNEALGTSLSHEPAVGATATQVVQPERRLSAVAALREFFHVSPLWLRGATAFAGLLLCVLVVLTISRIMQRPAVAVDQGEPKIYTATDFKAAVDQGVKSRTEQMRQAAAPEQRELAAPKITVTPNEMAKVRQPAKPRVKALSPEESVQLAADLRLIPSEDEEQSSGIVDLPNQ